jgi:repressor LexA
MNVKVEIELCASVKQKDKKEMYGAAEFLTNDSDSIYIYQPTGESHNLVAEFTINKARQIDVVDRIGKEFSYNMENYSQSTVSFPYKPTKKKITKIRCKYTPKQGQYLSFIYYFTRLNVIPPAEADMQRYFKTSPPTVHNMIFKLEEKGFIQRKPKTPRSIKLLLPRSELPDLE